MNLLNKSLLSVLAMTAILGLSACGEKKDEGAATGTTEQPATGTGTTEQPATGTGTTGTTTTN
jgi:uncharacterized lipoprotein YehR (DUF1307 family)